MLVHSVNQRQLHSKVDSEGGQVTSTPRLTCLPTCQHCIEVALRGQHEHWTSWPRCTCSPPHATSAKDHLDMVTLSRSMFMEVNSVALSGVSAGSPSETEQQSCTVAVPCPHLVWRENWCREKLWLDLLLRRWEWVWRVFFMTGVFMTFFWDFFTKGICPPPPGKGEFLFDRTEVTRSYACDIFSETWWYKGLRNDV